MFYCYHFDIYVIIHISLSLSLLVDGTCESSRPAHRPPGVVRCQLQGNHNEAGLLHLLREMLLYGKRVGLLQERKICLTRGLLRDVDGKSLARCVRVARSGSQTTPRDARSSGPMDTKRRHVHLFAHRINWTHLLVAEAVGLHRFANDANLPLLGDVLVDLCEGAELLSNSRFRRWAQRAHIVHNGSRNPAFLIRIEIVMLSCCCFLNSNGYVVLYICELKLKRNWF